MMYNKKRTLSLKLVKLLIEGILLAMEYLSSKNIVHNFVNSTSVYINRGYLPKLGNFEYAFSRYDGEPIKQRKYTMTANEFHFPYIAPELHKDETQVANSSSDMYRYTKHFCIFQLMFFSRISLNLIPLVPKVLSVL